MSSPIRKKLIEVALPLTAISEGTAREKMIHTGHPANLHTWWSRKPLAAARAVLFASLVDDPANDLPDHMADPERQRLFQLIERLVMWESIGDELVLAEAQAEIAKSAGGNLPSFLDPFCGGGSIPLEA